MHVREAIKRLRGTQANNQLTMLVCDELEKRLQVPAAVRGGYQPPAGGERPQSPKTVSGVICPACEARRRGRTRAQSKWRERKRHGLV